MKNGTLIIEGDIGDINEKIFSKLKEKALAANVMNENAIEESGGIPIGVKVKNRLLTLNKGTNLLHARVTFEMKL
ncbi:MAG: hypothetical protein AAB781_00910 [Patescibacteria group bacterium]